MYRLKIILLIAVATISQSACAQNKETVYLIFEENSQVNCIKIKNKSYLRNDTLRIKYIGKMRNHGTPNKPSFTVCTEKFLLKKDSEIEKVKANDLEKFNVVPFDFFIKRRFETNKVTKTSVFHKIYFLEKVNDNEYLKYEVYWNQSAHNKGI